jgi:hypothetical protein
MKTPVISLPDTISVKKIFLHLIPVFIVKHFLLISWLIVYSIPSLYLNLFCNWNEYSLLLSSWIALWSLTPREHHRLMALRRILGRKRDEVTRDRRKLQNAELRSHYVIIMVSLRKMRWTGHVARMGATKVRKQFWLGSLKEIITQKT